jgi:hypothetical protein
MGLLTHDEDRTMAITLKWLIRDRVILEEYVGDINIQQVTEAMKNVEAMVEASGAPLVHALADTSAMKGFPTHLIELQNATRSLLSHPRYGWLIIYGRNDMMLRFILQVLTGVFKVRLRMFDTRDEALEFLATVDSTLHDELHTYMGKSE